MYKSFAKIYDKAMEGYDYPYVADFIKRHIKKGSEVLEMACGSGSLTKLLEKEYELSSFDISEEMLKIAEEKVKGFKNFSKQDMRSFSYDKSFDAIICLCDSINYILKEDQLIEVFEGVKKHLKDGGLFIFDVNTIYNFEENFSDEIFYEDGDDYFYVWDNFYDSEKTLNYYSLIIFRKEESGYEKSYEEHVERAYDIDSLKEILLKNKFKKIEIKDSYTDLPYKKYTERAVFICQK